MYCTRNGGGCHGGPKGHANHGGPNKQLVAGLSGSLEGDSSSHGPNPREDRGQLESSVASIGTQPPCSK